MIESIISITWHTWYIIKLYKYFYEIIQIELEHYFYKIISNWPISWSYKTIRYEIFVQQKENKCPLTDNNNKNVQKT